jgi:uncharacterized protein
MIYAIAALLIVVNTLCLAMVLLRLPGIWLMVLMTTLAAIITWDEGMFSVWTLGVVFVLALISEVLEFMAGAVGTKKAGGSQGAAWAAMFGGIAGAIGGTFLIPVPVVGSLLGAILGAAGAAALAELAMGREMGAAAMSGAGAGAGTLAGAIVKLMFGVVVWLIIAVAAFVP